MFRQDATQINHRMDYAGRAQGAQLLCVDESFAVGDFFDAGDLQTLPLFDRLNAVDGTQQNRQRLVGQRHFHF